MSAVKLIFQTKDVYLVGELLSFYTQCLDTTLYVVNDEGIESLKPYFEPDKGDWYLWSMKFDSSSFAYFTAIKALARIKNIIGAALEYIPDEGILRPLNDHTIGVQHFFMKYKVTSDDILNQNIMMMKLSSRELNSEPQNGNKGFVSRIKGLLPH